MCVVPAERNPATTAGETATPRLGPWGTCPFPAPDVQRLCTATARPGRRGHGGDVVVVGRRSSWVPSSMCVREKPEGLAFAVPMWARGEGFPIRRELRRGKQASGTAVALNGGPPLVTNGGCCPWCGGPPRHFQVPSPVSGSGTPCFLSGKMWEEESAEPR
jgi:hypothetical protein